MTASITYEVSEYDPSDSSAEVVYTRESDGFIYKRYVNIPHLEDGPIDEDYFKQILDGQLSGVINKLKVGAVTFQDPDADPVGIAST